MKILSIKVKNVATKEKLPVEIHWEYYFLERKSNISKYESYSFCIHDKGLLVHQPCLPFQFAMQMQY